MSTKAPEPTLLELAQAVATQIETNGGNVSDQRAHSVESHLRTVIRHLGYKPRETKENKAGISDLASQTIACLQAGDVSETVEAEIRAHLATTISNVKADSGVKTAPALKEAPEAPAGKKAKAAAAAMAILLFLLTLFIAPNSRAYDSFNVTNVIMGATNFLFQQWPTNAQSTNFTITGYTTNGAQITTNGYYLSQATGTQLEVKNYSQDGVSFVASGYGVTNAATTFTVKLVRAWSDNVPRVIWNTNTGVIQTNDWEQAPGGITLSWIQTNSGPWVWGTNLDAYTLGGCTYLGVYYWSNQPFGLSFTNLWDTNIVFGLQKLKKARAFSPGNF